MRALVIAMALAGPALGQTQQAAAAAVVAPVALPASVKNGVDLWRKGKWADAVVMWRPFADGGNLDAMFNMGQASKLGRGTPKDEARARDWYAKAAERGHRPAQANFGILLFQAGQKAEALRWLKMAADAGEPRAQYVYGVAHWNGDGVRKSLTTAYAYLARAADQGLAEARTAIDLLTPKMSVTERTSGWQLATALAKADGSRGTLTSIPKPASLEVAVAPVPQTPSVSPGALGAAPGGRTSGDGEVPLASLSKPAKAFRVQIGAYSRRELADAALAAIKSRSPALLADVTPVFQYDGALTRLQFGAYAGPEESKAACARFVAAGYSCITVDAS